MGHVSDGTHSRPVLACGCTPSATESVERGLTLASAHLPDEIIPEPMISEVEQFDPAHEEARIRSIVSKVLAEIQDAGLNTKTILDAKKLADGAFSTTTLSSGGLV